MNRKIIFCLALAMLGSYSNAQTNLRDYPVVGERSPNIVFDDVRFGDTKRFFIHETNGKWKLLDFWSKGCSGCFTILPELNRINHLLHDSLDVLLIGRPDRGTEALYEKVRGKLNLTIPAVFDSAIFARFGIYSVPHIVIVDPNGIVRAVTYGSEVTLQKMERLIASGSVAFQLKKNKFQETEPSVVQASQSNGPPQMIYGSYLTIWDREHQGSNLPVLHNVLARSGTFEITGVRLTDLYFYAYFGTAYWLTIDSLYASRSMVPVLELSDSYLFASSCEREQDCFSYFAKRPVGDANAKLFQEQLRADLASAFGFRVSIEKRMVPCWKLTSDQSAKKKLPTSGASGSYSSDYAGIKMVNQPIARLISKIAVNNQSQSPIIDDTGIRSNIDLELSALFISFDDVQSELKKHGLYLVRSYTEMNALVVREPEATRQ